MLNTQKLFVLGALFCAALSLQAQNFNLELRSTLDYPNQTLANICGYAQDGREYALIGASKGLAIADVTNPGTPIKIVQIPGRQSLWQEIKVYRHYAYVVTEGGGGVQIVDLSKLPSADLDYQNYTGTGEIEGLLDAIHALHIDTTKGFLYTFGGTFSTVRVHDLNADPYNPTYAGKFDDLGYIHDGYADNDTLYAAHIFNGLLSVVDMRDKQNPVLLGTVETPARFTHNAWLLSDRKHILTTDERTPSFLTMYDVSDPSDIRELDRFSTNDGNGSIGHNTHVWNDWAITSWYTDGVSIVDAHRPDNLVQVGYYDTWPGTGPSFDGCWGAFPFLPSGNILATNIPSTNGGVGRLFVFTPTYVRAAYLEGVIRDGCNFQPLANVEIEVTGIPEAPVVRTAANGSVKTGIAREGIFNVTLSKPGYVTQNLLLNFSAGNVTPLNVILQPVSAYDVQAKIVDQNTGAPIPFQTMELLSATTRYKVQSDGSGRFNLNCMHGGAYRAGTWGYRVGDVLVGQDGALNIALEPGYYDDFELDLGWSRSATATDGFWELGDPRGTTFNSILANPEDDADGDNNTQCYVTGNAGGSISNDDVDRGSVTLRTPPMNLAAYSDAVLNFQYWFYNFFVDDANPPNDSFEVRVNNGAQSATVFVQKVSESAWRSSGDIHLKDFLPLTDNMRVEFIAYDNDPGHWVEAAVDIFQVTPGAVAVRPEVDVNARLDLSPNPSASDFRLIYQWPDASAVQLEVRNLLGQPVLLQALNGPTGSLRFGSDLASGLYLVRLVSEGRQSAVVKVVKEK